MRKFSHHLLAGIVLLFGLAAGLRTWFTPKLPHQQLHTGPGRAGDHLGGEFRVLQVRYGTGEHVHAFRRAAEWKFRAWNALPKRLQNVIPYPERGHEAYSTDHPAVSIWWAWINPEQHEPEIGQTSSVTVTLDDGESLPPIWSEPDGEYREILIIDPPRNTRYLRLEFRVWYESVHFTIDNPAYHQP